MPSPSARTESNANHRAPSDFQALGLATVGRHNRGMPDLALSLQFARFPDAAAHRTALPRHKVLRWLILPLLFLCALAALLASGPAAALILTGIGLFGLCAALGARGKGGLPGRIGWLFTLQGAAAMIGLLRLARGNRYVTWNPRGQ